MNRLTKANKDKVTQFRGITGASEKQAIDCLKLASWALEPAIDHFYTSGLSSQVAPIDQRAIDALYEKYANKDETITTEGIMQLCEDLAVQPEDEVMLVISSYMNAKTMGEFTKEEFSTGMFKMGCDSSEKLKKKLPELRAELRGEDRFKDIYLYAFGWSCDKGTKCVQLETATGMWQLLLGRVRPWTRLDVWLEFLAKHHNRAISKDTWNQLYDFVQTVKPDFSNYDENSAWPYLLDEFVENSKAKP
mmetsp:Transcript_10145/g.17665  ORF Transcript_10145/g.17665 Transcript_10145/m.17665 type:complete len:248 (-) Transcript_10145:498-1241(-)|eukprot:CAMPEP_0119107178 /NCGR_PEP_ID=MMETSP1180-20130426/8922_1 /TAXON_ID=3052 ORGANISM="Chlamydomonas cf sp, Strain CCMP681" /NCGR_SAMPLE_ID=MMETSP1180 /ASSEMBLY_ACC=CAM_ASM_000741 /LENGTH=247 /DNA_ID=CAMNT_0007092631 /DNA_START=181 /DNA_END=924 /DNA_ORIENTATION=+